MQLPSSFNAVTAEYYYPNGISSRIHWLLPIMETGGGYF